ncbi:hypothetical protein ONS95_008220 [Cadophora gregata]|uniref:uncharacterized protein n=1 Tax=Cadophora gregata TaxID=51156 RepID=UPI0026DAF9CE|nr:uncharacterized protein ONS95_008220 [Cadophora gregata]KAK0126634.1 hypothetical protein ONS95_008220 [Cadophora gregata]
MVCYSHASLGLAVNKALTTRRPQETPRAWQGHLRERNLHRGKPAKRLQPSPQALSCARNLDLPIYIDDDDTAPPETGLGSSSKKDKPLASSSDYGGSSDNEDLVAAAAQVELMRSWVDCGIQMATKEMEAERLGGRLGEEDCDPNRATSGSSQAPMPQSIQPPRTPITQIYRHNTGYATPLQSEISHSQYYNGVPQYQSMGTLQTYPAASILPYSQTYPTPQHKIAYAPPIHLTPHNSLPPTYYATPPTSQPPFLQNPAFCSSSAPPQSSPTPQPYAGAAFHTDSISQSSGFAPPNRQPLNPASTNIQTPTSDPKSRLRERPFVLPPGQYLSWHELEQYYGPARQNFPHDDAYKSARLDWVQKIKINEPPFNHPWIAEYKKQEVEDTWAGIPATKRNHIEMLALASKYRTMVQAPCREVPAYALPLSFMALEAQYFSIPERKLASDVDTIRKRSTWLTDLGLFEPIYYLLCSNHEQELFLENTYNKLSVVKRRAIEAKAKYLNVMLNPPKPLFKEFEEQYSIHKEEDFGRKPEHKTKRGDWLRAIGLDFEPFCWYPYTTTEFGVAQSERTEVAWNDLGLAKRRELESKAAEYKSSQTWGLSWGQIEDRIGFTPGDGEKWTRWLAAIGMGRALKSNETRDGVWQMKLRADRQAIYRLAAVQKKEIQARWEARQVVQARAQAQASKQSKVKAKAGTKPAKVSKVGKSSRFPRGGYASYSEPNWLYSRSRRRR